MSTGVSGYAAARLPMWQRLARVGFGVAVLVPWLGVQIAATGAALAIAALDILRRRGIDVLPTNGGPSAEKG
jgi:hypothetical protein